MSSQHLNLSGCYTAIITPFTADASEVDLARLETQIQYQHESGVTGIVPCGTTGESPTLTDSEHRAVVEKAVEVGKPLGLQVIAGAGSNNTAHAIELHKFAAAAGADASLQVNPYYSKPSQEGLLAHFRAIADSCDLPIVLYNIPGRSAVALEPKTVARLAEHENIVAIKEATGSLDSASEIIVRCGDSLTLLSGDDSMTLPFASVGGQGVVSVVSNLLPLKTAALCKAFLTDDWPVARLLHFHLFGVSKALLGLDTNPVPIKTALMLLGCDSGALRLPMCPASDEVVAKIQDMLHRNHILPRTAIASA